MDNKNNQDFNSKAISDDELDAVSGGAFILPKKCNACGQSFSWNTSTPAVCPYCKQPF